MRVDGTGFRDNHTTTDLVLVDTAEQQTHVIASFTFVQNLAEHFHTGNDRLQLLSTHTDDIDGVAGVDDTGLDTTSGNGTTAGDGEHVLDGHEEVFIDVTRRQRNPSVNGIHQFHDLLNPLGFFVQAAEGRAADDGGVVAVEAVEREKVADFHFDEVEKLGVVNKVNLVHEDHHSRNADLLGEQDVAWILGVANGTRRNLRRVAHRVDFHNEVNVVLRDGVRRVGIRHEVVGENHHLVGILSIGLGISQRAADGLRIL